MAALIRSTAVCEFTQHGYLRDVSITSRAQQGSKDSPLKTLEQGLEDARRNEEAVKNRE